MTRLARFAVLLLAAAISAGPAATAADPSSAISIPVPQLPDREMVHYQVVELAGASPATEDLLADGTPPAVLVDFTSRLERIWQRLTLYENAIIAVEVEGDGWRMAKKVRIPDQALDSYKAFFVTDELERFRPWSPGDASRDQTVLRIASGGRDVSRSWPSTAVIPEQIERLRLVLQDVVRALSEDREVTNPIVGYKASIGDVLIGDDQKSYKVVRILQQGALLELESASEPVRRFVAVKDLHLYFFTVRPATP